MPRALALAVALLAASCSPSSYPRTTLPAFRTEVPRAVAFEGLVRRAAQLGYVRVNVDPTSTTFAVYAHALGRGAPQRRRRAPRRGREIIRDDIFIVEVSDAEVRVRPFGPHVIDDDQVHPELAAELRVFARSLRDTVRALRTGGLAAIVGAPAPSAGMISTSTSAAGAVPAPPSSAPPSGGRSSAEASSTSPPEGPPSAAAPPPSSGAASALGAP
jgi:hypothetical protein